MSFNSKDEGFGLRSGYSFFQSTSELEKKINQFLAGARAYLYFLSIIRVLTLMWIYLMWRPWKSSSYPPPPKTTIETMVDFFWNDSNEEQVHDEDLLVFILLLTLILTLLFLLCLHEFVRPTQFPQRRRPTLNGDQQSDQQSPIPSTDEIAPDSPTLELDDDGDTMDAYWILQDLYGIMASTVREMFIPYRLLFRSIQDNLQILWNDFLENPQLFGYATRETTAALPEIQEFQEDTSQEEEGQHDDLFSFSQYSKKNDALRSAQIKKRLRRIQMKRNSGFNSERAVSDEDLAKKMKVSNNLEFEPSNELNSSNGSTPELEVQEPLPKRLSDDLMKHLFQNSLESDFVFVGNTMESEEYISTFEHDGVNKSSEDFLEDMVIVEKF